MSLLWLLIDGLSHRLHERLVPWMADLRIDCALPLEPLSPNCQTPPSLFSIWSGLDASAHGLTGYDMPVAGGPDPLATVDSFARWPRAVPMVWDRWAAEGRRVRTSAVPFVQVERLAGALLSHTDVYAPLLAAPRVLKAGEVLAIASLQLHAEVGVDGDAMVLHGTAGGSVRVPFGSSHHIPLENSLPISVAGETNRAFAVHAAHVDGEPRLCFLGYQPVVVHGRDAAARRAALMERACSIGNPAKLHASGALGRHADQGGDGSAERLLLDLLDVMHRSFLDDILWSLRAGDAELMVAYYPVIDLVSHQLLRYVEAPVNAPQKALADAILARMAGWVGELLRCCQSAIPPDCRFIAHSDHGMSPLSHDLSPNSFFKERGWLASTDEGRIDAARSLVFYHPAENGWLALHPERMALTGLTAEDIVQALDDALPDASSKGFRLLEGPAITELAGGWRSRWYLQPPRGTRLRAEIAPAFAARSRKGGDHTCWSDDPWLKGVFLEPQLIEGAPAWELPLTLMQLAPTLMHGLRMEATA